MPARTKTLLPILAACALAACAKTSSSARVRFVHPGGTGAGNSWNDAAGSLQAILEQSRPGDEVWVASGTYRPAGPGGPRGESFQMREGVALRGGFSGGEASPEERDPQAPASILDGDLDADDGPDFSARADNSYHVLVAHMIQSGTLERFTVRGGYADGPALGAHVESGDQGSGLNVYHSHPRVIDCRFVDNWASNHGTVNDHGGGTYEDCEFSANRAGSLGAGLYFHGDIEAHAYRCRFYGNRTPGQGGGAYSRSYAGSSLEDCTFIGNQAERGGGLYMAEGSATTLARGEFLANVGDIGGGGLYIENGTGLVQECSFVGNSAGHDVQDGGAGSGGSGGGGLWASVGAPTIEDCVFDSNTASFGAGVYLSDATLALVRRCQFLGGLAFEAGGLYVLHSPATAEDCLFLGNTAAGGGFSVGGGMSVYFSLATARRCRFVDNAAELGGGGLYTEGEAPSFDRCEFVGNSAFGDKQGWGGGYMAGYHTVPRLTNCSFQGNRANQGGGMFAIAFAEPTLVNASFSGNAALQQGGGIAATILSAPRLQNTVCWSNFPDEWSGAEVLFEQSSVGIDPHFVLDPQAGPDGDWATQDDLRGNLRLGSGSACRDAGDNARLGEDETLDLDGNPRFRDDPATRDSGVGSAPVVDLGAYEADS
ncbi:MAG: right-handed parallel beta-helix repeat-containing protein [Planctomycetes bacterium]|nr:right-handed parallel beta-helix repeat-containing protein [Planctomycetota bacterium]